MKGMRIIALLGLIIGLVLIGYVAGTLHFRNILEARNITRSSIHGDLEIYYVFRTIIATVNAGILINLLIIYTGIYLRTRAEFSFGLVVFATALLIYAITSNPLIQVLFRFRPFGLGPFAIIPELFTTVAVVVLLYLSLK